MFEAASTGAITAVLVIWRGMAAPDIDTLQSIKVSLGRFSATMNGPAANGPIHTGRIDCGIRCG